MNLKIMNILYFNFFDTFYEIFILRKLIIFAKCEKRPSLFSTLQLTTIRPGELVPFSPPLLIHMRLFEKRNTSQRITLSRVWYYKL